MHRQTKIINVHKDKMVVVNFYMPQQATNGKNMSEVCKHIVILKEGSKGVKPLY